MSKLISNPTECGYRVNELEACTHKKYNSQHCPSCFPTNCPLPDGVSIPYSKDELAIIAKNKKYTMMDAAADLTGPLKQSIPLIPKSPTDTTDKMIKRLKRRDRRNCIYGYTPKSLNTILHCMHIHIPFAHCQGVNCGKFETKPI